MNQRNMDFPGRGSEQYIVRFPDGMRDKIKDRAAANGRSMNGEIIHILRQSLGNPSFGTAKAYAQVRDSALGTDPTMSIKDDINSAKAGTINPWMPEPDAMVHQVLGKIGEECNEMGAALFRCLIQGFDESEPVSGKPNRRQFWEEVADIEAAIAWAKETLNAPDFSMEDRRARKLAGFRAWQTMIDERVG